MVFTTNARLSNHVHTAFFTAHNIIYSQRELNKIGVVAEQVVRQVLAFYEIRSVFVSSKSMSVVLKTGKQWETLPDQIVRIIEKALDEFGIEL